MTTVSVAGCGWVGLELESADAGGAAHGGEAGTGGGADASPDGTLADGGLGDALVASDGGADADGAADGSVSPDGALPDGALADAAPCPDADGDGVCDAVDLCPGSPDGVDSDGDGTPDGCDGCPSDGTRTAAGVCGCGVTTPPPYSHRYSFDETAGSVARDSAGGRNATLQSFQGTPWAAGQLGNGLAFDGVDDVASVGALATGPSALTFYLRADSYGLTTSQTNWTVATSTGSPRNDWSNPSNAFAQDGRFTNYGALLGLDRAQDYGGFNFGLPSAAQVRGIEVTTTSQNTLSLTATFGVALSWNAGASYTSARNAPLLLSGALNYGGATDTWGHAFSAAELGTSSFRLRLQSAGIPLLQLSQGVDYVAARVFYAPLTVPRVVMTLGPGTRVELNGANIALVGFPSGTQVYVDGVLGTAIDSAFHHIAIVAPSALAASALSLGGPSSAGAYLDGMLDELRLYDTPLSAAGVRTVYQVPACIP